MRLGVLLCLALLCTPACSSGSTPVPQPPPITDYRAAAPAPYSAAPPTAYGAPAPGATRAGTFRWHERLADAQAEARATGRLILAASTKPDCGLCEKFRHEIVPATQSRVAAVAVGYVYDITRPESPQLNALVRANLPDARLMPLVGFVTSELRWVHGFWGATSPAEFNGVIAETTRRYPVRVASVSPLESRNTTAAVMNEFGEMEWSLPQDVWPNGLPAPIDALPGTPALPAALATQPQPVLAQAPSGWPTPSAAPASSSPAPPSTPAAMPVAAPVAPLRPLPPVAQPPAIAAPPAVIASQAPLPIPRAPIAAVPAAPVPAPAAPWSTPAPGPSASSPAAAPAIPHPAAPAPHPAAPAAQPQARPSADWATEALRQALAEIKSGRYDAARQILGEVRSRLPGTEQARSAAKGDVAIYNAKRIEQANDPTERSQYLERARRDLGTSIWGELFA